MVDTEQARVEKANTNLTCLASVVDSHFEGDQRLHSRAFLVLKNGHLIYEKYKQSMLSGEGGDGGWSPTTRLHGWSMTKSLLNTLVGVRVQQNKLSVDTTLDELLPADKIHPDHRKITIFDLLTMTDGANIDETYVPGSATVRMLFESTSLMNFSKSIGRRSRGYGCFRYSSFTTNVLSAALAGSFTSME
jgi:CubicO group peptidase (beta-lactamase class C family)